MGRAASPQQLSDFLGSTQAFATALTEGVEARLLREVASEKLSHSQFKLLKLVANTDAHSIGDVASFLGVSNAAASKAVDKLVRRMLLRRLEGEADRREAALSLTVRAQRLLAAYDAALDKRLTEIFGVFSPEELERTSEILDRLSAEIIDHNANPEEVCLQCGLYLRERCLVRELVARRCFYVVHKKRRGQQSATKNEERSA